MPAQETAQHEVEDQASRYGEAKPGCRRAESDQRETGYAAQMLRHSEERAAEAGERPQQRQLERVGKIIHKLQGGEVQPPDHGGEATENRWDSKDRKYSEYQTKGKAERQFFR